MSVCDQNLAGLVKGQFTHKSKAKEKLMLWIKLGISLDSSINITKEVFYQLSHGIRLSLVSQRVT